MIKWRMPKSCLLIPLILLQSLLPAQDAAAEVPVASDPSLRPTLEAVYLSWRNAMAATNVAEWEKSTALSRQFDTRNRIVSQKLPFPQALFDDPVEAPSLSGLIALGVLSTGETATSTYFGKANFGEGETAVANNLIVLHFIREEGVWKFDNLRVVKLGNDGEILLQIRNQDFSFLRGKEFLPEPELPPLPPQVSQPDYIAEIWLTSLGYETEVSVNGILSGKISDNSGKDLLIGGLRKGENSITIKTKRIPESNQITPRLEIAIYAAGGPGEQANRVFHLPAGETVAPLIQQKFVAD